MSLEQIPKNMVPVTPPILTILGAKDTSVTDAANGVTCLAAEDKITDVSLCKVRNIGTDAVTITHGTVESGNGELLNAGETFLFRPEVTPPFAICASGKSTTIRVIQYK